MGAVQNAVRSTTHSIWDKMPSLEGVTSLQFSTQNNHQSFVNLAVSVGAITVLTSAVSLTRRAIKLALPNPIPDISNKYGHKSWAVVCVDFPFNQEYALLLAEQGFNLVLIGERFDRPQHIFGVTDIDRLKSKNVQVEVIEVKWTEKSEDLTYFQDLQRQLEQKDISVAVLPKLQPAREQIPTHLELPQTFKHIYLLIRYLAPLLNNRKQRGVIVLPSYNWDPAYPNNGVTQSIIKGVDVFGRTVGFELKKKVDLVVARGTCANAFRGLIGGVRITE